MDVLGVVAVVTCVLVGGAMYGCQELLMEQRTVYLLQRHRRASGDVYGPRRSADEVVREQTE